MMVGLASGKMLCRLHEGFHGTWVAAAELQAMTRELAQVDFGLGRRSRTRASGIAPPVVGKDKREFHGVAEILAGGMQRIGMEKDRIAGCQVDQMRFVFNRRGTRQTLHCAVIGSYFADSRLFPECP